MRGAATTAGSLAVLLLVVLGGGGCSSGRAEAQAGSAANAAAAGSAAEAAAAAAAAKGDRAAGMGSGAAATKPIAVDPPMTLPASWKPMPEVVKTVEDALAESEINGAAVAAWGDAGRGCYAIQLAAREKGAPVARVEAGLRKGFGAPPASAEGAEGAATGSAATGSAAANAGSAELAFELSTPLPGLLRTRLRYDGEATRLAAAVCFFNARYPEQCRRHCDSALASLEAP